MFNILENFDLKKSGRWSPETNHLMIEAMKRAFADRARYLGDPDFTKIPAELTTKEYAKKLAAGIDLKKPTPSASLAPDIALDKESDSTTHFSVIDKDGLAVSNTYTLENSYGNRVVVRGAGYILNNEMTDFNPRPGFTSTKGHIGTKPNQIAPGKRMLSSMTPVIVLKDGKPVARDGQPRRQDDHQHGVLHRAERHRIRNADRRSGERPPAPSPVAPGHRELRGSRSSTPN